MGKIFIQLLVYFLITSLISCNSNKKEEISEVVLCALDKLMTDSEFRDYLISGENYLAWVSDGYVEPDSVITEDGKIAWSSLEYIKVNNSHLELLNNRFPEGHKLKMVSQQENENILKNKKDGRFSCWYFGGLKRYKKRYFISGGFAVSTKAGIGASFIIEIDNGECKVIDYHPVIY